MGERKRKLFHAKGTPEYHTIWVCLRNTRGTWVAQKVEHLTSVQVMISQFVSSRPTLGSVLTAQSLEPASDSLPPSLSAPPPLMLSVSQK